MAKEEKWTERSVVGGTTSQRDPTLGLTTGLRQDHRETAPPANPLIASHQVNNGTNIILMKECSSQSG